MRRHIRKWLAVPVAVGIALFLAASADAHIQVLPGEVAPADPVLFTVLVPGETSAGTSKVELKVPSGVYPFSYEDTPGWKRKLITKPNGLVDRIVWTGRAAPDGLVRFTFLAGTPEKPGTVRWAAIQTYANGREALWIGDPDSEHPAPVTVVSESAPKQNAGGEAADGESGGVAEAETVNQEVTDGTDWPVTIAALLGFFFGLSSMVILLLNRKKRGT